MAHSIQRATMYILLIALERDIRDFIALYVIPSAENGKILNDTFRKKAEDRLKKDDPNIPHTEQNLLGYLDLGDSLQIVRSFVSRVSESTKKYVENYWPHIEKLIPIRNRVMHARPLEYEDYAKINDLSFELLRSNNSLWANLRTARREIEQNPTAAASIVIPRLQDESLKVLHNLPPSEFDDTGFIGRDKELADLRRAIDGPYPIITVSGDGGFGKTAITLKTCYEILDEENPVWDAIVWATSKAARLTASEIEHIEGAISSSLGIIEHAADFLGRQASGDAIDDLLLHLKNNKILLVIDNLETILDDKVREFAKNIPIGSKVIFTTRIGLGMLDFPIPIRPLMPKDSAFYFRRTAKVWSNEDLATSEQSFVDETCKNLQHSPLFIKWYIQGSRGGRRKSPIAANNDLLLSFCLQNVFSYLSPAAQHLTKTLACLSETYTTAGLVYLTENDIFTIQKSLTELMTANLLLVDAAKTTEDEDRYSLSTFARSYVQKFLLPSRDEQRRIIDKQNALRFAHEEYTARGVRDIFDMNSVAIRDKDDYIAATLLKKAIDAVFRGRISQASSILQQTIDISPNYFEVKRVEAFVRMNEDRIIEAEAAYEAAVSLAPERAPLRLWYGGFISRQLGDQPRALIHLSAAEEMAPNEPDVKLEIARVYQYQKNFTEAAKRLDAVSGMPKLPAKQQRVLYDLKIQNETRRCEYLIGEKNFEGALVALETARSIASTAPPTLIDDRSYRNIQRARRQIPALARAFRNLEEDKRVKDIADWLINPLMPPASKEARSVESKDHYAVETDNALPNRGRLANLNTNFGFIVSGGDKVFFHRNDWKSEVDFLDLGEGTIVEFFLVQRERGPAAQNVRPIGDLGEAKPFGDRLKGHITSLSGQGGEIHIDDGRVAFFRHQNCLPGTKFKMLFAGERVRFMLVRRGGKDEAVAVESYSGL